MYNLSSIDHYDVSILMKNAINRSCPSRFWGHKSRTFKKNKRRGM